ncbi:unnamed protein product [Protopolystoma xenopodis]|uniref:Uncharacterized protein n=1 Tax=Protopolystoma xenopodis TaxID=117903 RepID=A0A448WJL4_9PLAT|nr:unnamed protein product [Protopolystoma xenopodis]
MAKLTDGADYEDGETFENVPSPPSDAGNHDNYYGRRLRTSCVLLSRPDNKTKFRQRGQPTFINRKETANITEATTSWSSYLQKNIVAYLGSSERNYRLDSGFQRLYASLRDGSMPDISLVRRLPDRVGLSRRELQQLSEASHLRRTEEAARRQQGEIIIHFSDLLVSHLSLLHPPFAPISRPSHQMAHLQASAIISLPTFTGLNDIKAISLNQLQLSLI